jgi:hypothetical protein
MLNRSQRGSSLVVSVIVIVILTVIAVAMVRFAAREQAGALASMRHDALVACARAAARVLESQFGLGVSPSAALDITIGNPADRESPRIVGGHVDQDMTVTDVKIAQVTPTRTGAFTGAQRGVVDQTNVLRAFGMNSGPKKVVAHCQMGDKSGPTTGRQVEVEFDVLTGL